MKMLVDILGVIEIVLAVIFLILGYLVIINKIKPSKSFQVLCYIIISILMFGSAIYMFSI